MTRILSTVARILAGVFVAFITIFVADVFGDFSWIALFMHLIPSVIALGLMILAWYKPIYGGALFLIIGVALVFIQRSALLSAPLIVIGILFLIQGLLDKFGD